MSIKHRGPFGTLVESTQFRLNDRVIYNGKQYKVASIANWGALDLTPLTPAGSMDFSAKMLWGVNPEHVKPA